MCSCTRLVVRAPGKVGETSGNHDSSRGTWNRSLWLCNKSSEINGVGRGCERFASVSRHHETANCTPVDLVVSLGVLLLLLTDGSPPSVYCLQSENDAYARRYSPEATLCLQPRWRATSRRYGWPEPACVLAKRRSVLPEANQAMMRKSGEICCS